MLELIVIALFSIFFLKGLDNIMYKDQIVKEEKTEVVR